MLYWVGGKKNRAENEYTEIRMHRWVSRFLIDDIIKIE